MLQQLLDQLAALAPGGFAAPEVTPDGLAGLVSGLLETLGLGQLGQLLEMLLTGANGGALPELGPETLGALLTSFGVGDALDPAHFAALLAGLGGGGYDASALADPVSGAEAEALQQAITEIVSVLAAALAGGTDAPTLEDIPLLADLIGTLFCSLLPLLC